MSSSLREANWCPWSALITNASTPALASFLAANGCDSLIVTGASTSGCVRATVVDALQHGYRPIVPREAVGDRNPAAHEANLYDIDAKYGDVVSVDEVVAHLEQLAGTLAEERAG